MSAVGTFGKIAAIAGLLLSIPGHADSWMVQIGGRGPEVVFDLVETRDQQLCAIGTFSAAADFGEGPARVTLQADATQDVYVACYAEDGTLIHAVQFGGDISDQPRAIAAFPNGDILISGHFLDTFGAGNSKTLQAHGGADIFLIRLNAAGKAVWSRSFGGNFADYGNSLAISSAGDILLAGSFQESIFFETGRQTKKIVSAGGRDAFVFRMNGEGEVVWAESFGGSGKDEASRVAVDDNGNVYIAGTFANYAATGQGIGELVAGEAEDAFLISFDANGELNWSRHLAGSGRKYVSGLQVDRHGDLYVSGNFLGNLKPPSGVTLDSQGGSDIFLLKLDNSGQEQWSRRVGGAKNDESFDLAVTADNQLLLSGHFLSELHIPLRDAAHVIESPGDENPDGFVLTADAAGGFLQALTVAGEGVETVFTIAALRDGGIASAGFFNKELAMQVDGLKTLVKRGETDVFVMRASLPGTGAGAADIVKIRDTGPLGAGPR